MYFVSMCMCKRDLTRNVSYEATLEGKWEQTLWHSQGWLYRKNVKKFHFTKKVQKVKRGFTCLPMLCSVAKVTTILREINKKNICNNVEVNICCINQYSVKKEYFRTVISRILVFGKLFQSIEYSNNTAATYCSYSIVPFLIMAKYWMRNVAGRKIMRFWFLKTFVKKCEEQTGHIDKHIHVCGQDKLLIHLTCMDKNAQTCTLHIEGAGPRLKPRGEKIE